jgi:hypothetical protein
MSRKSLLAFVVCLIASSTFAYRDHQETPPESSRQALAQRIFDRYVKALGGQEAYAKITSRSLKGKFEYNGSLQTTPVRNKQRKETVALARVEYRSVVPHVQADSPEFVAG